MDLAVCRWTLGRGRDAGASACSQHNGTGAAVPVHRERGHAGLESRSRSLEASAAGPSEQAALSYGIAPHCIALNAGWFEWGGRKGCHRELVDRAAQYWYHWGGPPTAGKAATLACRIGASGSAGQGGQGGVRDWSLHPPTSSCPPLGQPVGCSVVAEEAAACPSLPQMSG